MEASTGHANKERTIQNGLQNHVVGDQPTATLFTSFGIGQSYLFHVEKEARDRVQECWEEIFEGHEEWSFKRLERYDKPLGETATLTLSAKNGSEAATQIEALRIACNDKLSAKFDCEHLLEPNCESIEVVFFTTGVAILILRLKPKDASATQEFFEKLQDEDNHTGFHEELQEIIELCKGHYTKLMNKAVVESEKRRKKGSSAKQRWSLSRFRQVDREGWKPKMNFSYPLFFVNHDTYGKRIEKILDRVVGSKWQRKRQSDKARVFYKRTEIYVDWSEALVSDPTNSREPIESNFIIALASWFALFLMNKNSSLFLLEAYFGMVTNKPQSNAEAVHQRNMAYKDVTDAALPIRWTTKRRDLFLLETIHRNWSSERWRKNIEERMKLLALHYKRLEDERNERSNRRLAFVAISLAVFTLASAVAALINLVDKTKKILGRPLEEIDFWLSLTIPLIIGSLLFWFFWLKPKLRSRRRNNKQPKDDPPAEAATENPQ